MAKGEFGLTPSWNWQAASSGTSVDPGQVQWDRPLLEEELFKVFKEYAEGTSRDIREGEGYVYDEGHIHDDQGRARTPGLVVCKQRNYSFVQLRPYLQL